MSKVKYLILLLPLMFLSCVDEDSQLGLGLIDSSDKIVVQQYDNFDIKACVFHEGDSLKTSDYRYMTLGSYTDTIFGRITPSIYTQISLSTSSINFPDYGHIDSLVLSLAYTGSYTKPNSSSRISKEQDMLVSVYELTQSFDDSASYYTNSTLAHNKVLVLKKDIRVSPSRNVIISMNGKNDTLVPQLRVKLPTSLINEFLAQGSFASNSTFIDYFKGLCIELTPKNKTTAGGIITYVDMYSSASGICMYYTDFNGKTQKYSFPFQSGTRRFTHIDYNFSSSALSYFQSHLHTSGDSLKLYIASQGVAYAKLNIADFAQWYKDSTQNLGMFNEAMLILPIDEDYLKYIGGDTTKIPNKIICYRRNAAGSLVYIDDAILSSSSYMGYYDSSLKAYKMRITSHLQNFLNSTIPSADLYLIADSKTSTATRVVLNGPKSPIRPAKIKIIYTR